MATNYNQILNTLASKAPVYDEETAARLEAAKASKLKRTVAGMAPEQITATPSLAGDLAAASVEESGKAMQDEVARQAQARQAVANLGLQQKEQEVRAGLEASGQAQTERQLGQRLQQTQGQQRAETAVKTQLTSEEIQQQRRLASLGIEVDNSLSLLDNRQKEQLASIGRDAKQKLFDARLQFETDEAGRKFSNEKQLMDYAVVSAVNQQQLADKLQLIEQAGKRELIIMEIAQRKIEQALEQTFASSQQQLDQDTRTRLVQMKQAFERAKARKERAAANRRLIGQAVMTAAIVAAPYAAPAIGVAGATALGVGGAAAGGAISNG